MAHLKKSLTFETNAGWPTKQLMAMPSTQFFVLENHSLEYVYSIFNLSFFTKQKLVNNCSGQLKYHFLSRLKLCNTFPPPNNLRIVDNTF